jgi:hypothetical protein
MNTQTSLFEMEPKGETRILDANKRPLLIGGIYIYKGEKDEPYYDGKYALCLGKDCFHFLFEGIDLIDQENEIACAHKMERMEGYGLAYNIIKNEWFIRNSAEKNNPDYIIASGKFNPDTFVKSLKPALKIFMK